MQAVFEAWKVENKRGRAQNYSQFPPWTFLADSKEVNLTAVTWVHDNLVAAHLAGRLEPYTGWVTMRQESLAQSRISVIEGVRGGQKKRSGGGAAKGE
jgi:hypothetical protein